jgi:hypothetical protein
MNSSSRLLERRQLIALLGGLGIGVDVLAQDATRADPRDFVVLLENDRIRVLEYTSRPGMGICGNGVHSHPEHLNIAMTPVKARVTLPDGKTFIASNNTGDVFWEPAVTHSVENIGGSGARVYMVEMKDPPPHPRQS